MARVACQKSDGWPMDVSRRVERRDELAASKRAAPGIDSVGIGSIAGTSISTCSVALSSASSSARAAEEGRSCVDRKYLALPAARELGFHLVDQCPLFRIGFVPVQIHRFGNDKRFAALGFWGRIQSRTECQSIRMVRPGQQALSMV